MQIDTTPYGRRRTPRVPGVPIPWPWHSHSSRICLIFSFYGFYPLAGIREAEWLHELGRQIKISIFCFLQQYSGIRQWFTYSRKWRILAACVSVKCQLPGVNHKVQKKEIVWRCVLLMNTLMRCHIRRAIFINVHWLPLNLFILIAIKSFHIDCH